VDVRPQRDVGAQASPSRTRLLVREVGAQTLVDNARTMTPLPAADARAQGSVSDVVASTSLLVIDVDPINAVPDASDQDLVGDPIQIEQPPKKPKISSVQVPSSSLTRLTLRCWEID
jgi:hypothetical protein